jgi:hypothetical protein
MQPILLSVPIQNLKSKKSWFKTLDLGLWTLDPARLAQPPFASLFFIEL